MISPQIAEFIQRAEVNEGFSLKELSKNMLLEIKTQNHIFYILLLNPKEGEVILQSDHPQLQEPQVFYHQGSTDGGSVVKLNWIGVGFRLRMNHASGGLMTTSIVKSFKIIEDETRTKNFLKAAEAYEQQETISSEEFDKNVRDLTINDRSPSNASW